MITITPQSGSNTADVNVTAEKHTGRKPYEREVFFENTSLNIRDSCIITKDAAAEFVKFNACSNKIENNGAALYITGKSNASLLLFSTMDTAVKLSDTYTVLGNTIKNGEDITGDPGAVQEYEFSMLITIAGNKQLYEVIHNIKVSTPNGIESEVAITQKEGVPFINVLQSNVTLDAQMASSSGFEIETNESWSIAPIEGYDIHPMSGTGNSYVSVVSRYENTGRNNIVENIVVKSTSEESRQKSVQLVQRGQVILVPDIGQDSYKISGKGGLLSLTGFTNAPSLQLQSYQRIFTDFDADINLTIIQSSGSKTYSLSSYNQFFTVPDDPGATEKFKYRYDFVFRENRGRDSKADTLIINGGLISDGMYQIEQYSVGNLFTYDGDDILALPITGIGIALSGTGNFASMSISGFDLEKASIVVSTDDREQTIATSQLSGKVANIPAGFGNTDIFRWNIYITLDPISSPVYRQLWTINIYDKSNNLITTKKIDYSRLP